jgi:transposase-like protein
MAEAEVPKKRAARRSWSREEKRRIVELTLRAGASVRAIAREQGVNPTSLHHWKARYSAGGLDAPVMSSPRAHAPEASATFVPVNVVPAVRRRQPAERPDALACRSGVLQLVLTSGATLRIETGALDAALVCALVSELQR